MTSPYPGGLEVPPGTQHEWGGLRITDPDAPVAPPYYGDHWVNVTGPDANGLPVGTPAGVGSPNGVHIGDPFTSVTILDESVGEWTDADGHPRASTRVGLVPLPPSDDYGDAPSLGVTVLASDGVVTDLIAPSRNWGP